MTLRKRIGIGALLTLAGALMLAGPADAAPAHAPEIVIYVHAPAPSPSPSLGLGAPPGFSGGNPDQLPSQAPTGDVPTNQAPDNGSQSTAPQGNGQQSSTPQSNGSQGTSVKPQNAEPAKKSSSSGMGKWLGIGGGLLAGIALGMGFVVFRRKTG